MTETKHTPGPWRVEKPSDELVAFARHALSYGVITGPEAAKRVLGEKPSVIVWANSAEGSGFFTEVALVAKNDEANARLIASAPDLLTERDRLREALEMLETAARRYAEGKDGSPSYVLRIAEKARAALKGE